MTNEEEIEEAIEILNNTAWLGSDTGIKVYPAVKMAVDALEFKKKLEILGDSWVIMPKSGTWVVNDIDVHEAIEKQIPKKPISVSTSDNEWIGFLCPVCQKVEFGFNQPRFCEGCGQAIDWSEVEG